MPDPTFPHHPYVSAFESWRAAQGRVPVAVCEAWSDVVGLTLTREVLWYGAGPEADDWTRARARSMAWEDLDMALRGGASGLLRSAVERLWMHIRTRDARAALGAALSDATALAHAEAGRSGWRHRYRVADLERPVLTNPHAHGLADVAEVYNEAGTRGRRLERLGQEPDLAALRAHLFGWKGNGPR